VHGRGACVKTSRCVCGELSCREYNALQTGSVHEKDACVRTSRCVWRNAGSDSMCMQQQRAPCKEEDMLRTG
jgi:hypothetical protein